MIRIFGRLYWSILHTLLPGPVGADRPILIIVEDDHDRATE